VSCIYPALVSIFVPLIRPLRREPCTTSPIFCINAHITWFDNSHGASFIVIFVTCFSTSTNLIYLFLISIPLVNRMCLVLGSKTVTMQFFLLFVWTVLKKLLIPIMRKFGRFYVRIFADNNRIECQYCSQTDLPSYCCVRKPSMAKARACFRCNSKDHTIKDCPHSENVYYNCGKEGHIRRNCEATDHDLYGVYMHDIHEGREADTVDAGLLPLCPPLNPHHWCATYVTSGIRSYVFV
jgi:hypothetical protein